MLLVREELTVTIIVRDDARKLDALTAYNEQCRLTGYSRAPTCVLYNPAGELQRRNGSRPSARPTIIYSTCCQ